MNILLQSAESLLEASNSVQDVLARHGFKKMTFDAGSMVGFAHKDNGRNQVMIKGSSWSHSPELNKSPIGRGRGGESLHQHLSGPLAQHYLK